MFNRSLTTSSSCSRSIENEDHEDSCENSHLESSLQCNNNSNDPLLSQSFKGYIKIDSSNKNWDLDAKQIKLFKKTKWIITEKVHGANFCFRLSRRNDLSSTTSIILIECAKRKSLLKDSDQFFYFQKVKEKLQSHLETIFQLVESKFNDIHYVYVFGELFGGYYPDMPQLPGIEQPIQTGIWYTNDIEFYAFDIAFEKKLDQIQTFIDYETCLSIFCQVGSKHQVGSNTTKLFLHAEPLFIGSYEECMEFQIKFESKIPKKLGMPSIKDYSNYAEGVVIKPLKELTISKKGKLERAIIKRKIQEFSEKKYEQAQKWTSNQTELSSDHNSSIDNFEFIKYETMSCVTMNRLNNAISKIGLIHKNDKTQMNQLLNAFVQDVFDEVKESNMEMYEQIDASQLKELNDLVTLECKKTIYEYFKQMK
ncbi:hypothetical protein C9374_007713 [Naegleria lovaniensis]|uniref:RNA ligase domain-containing protein n=1 Tax=Naegleria lovaniensis TaxID=51637 RepID=A0AA88KH04_NAELO|nr:uncharacterized protein C9374_007713 [Naegleria lovaniensis]KAG2379075.1 hypothetical protein C9374_007713 [Naegleria lovaniensis]